MNWLGFLFYCGAALAVYSFLMVPILMELSLNSPKRDTEGLLRINREGWIIKNLYQTNAVEKHENWPRNICQLYRGLWWGLFFFLFILAICLISAIIGFLFGYMASFSSSSPRLFHNYERWGKDDKKIWIAPWKILLPASWLSLALFWPETTATAIQKCADFLSATPSVMYSTSIIAAKGYLYYSICASAIILLLFLLLFFRDAFAESESWAAIKDFLTSIKDRLCIRTTVD